jgi:isoleucyl-tRNA synthetase
MVCIGSVEELEKYAGRKITDIHRHFIDDIEIPSKKGKGMLRRVADVFDCWFESGSMPYAQKHFPFENEKEFQTTFPANFIAEGLDQTRGWFYTLMVLATHLFDKPAFQNLIVNGLVLAADGKKMSKRLKNYPDPTDVCNRHGADAVRLYMCNSPVVRAEPLKFREEGVRDTVKDIFLPFYNAYRFFILEVGRFEGAVGKFKADTAAVKASTNITDKWLIASKNELIQFVRDEMEAYRLYTVAPRVVAFLDNLTNWYVRLNRDRMKGNDGEQEWRAALCTLYDVLLNVSILLAPLTPFITEFFYQNLSRALPNGSPLKAKSIHFVMIPEAEKSADAAIVTAMTRMQSIVELGRTCRERKKVGSKKPLKSMTIINKDESFIKDLQTLERYVREELNVEEIKYEASAGNVEYAGEANFKVLGKKLGKDMKKVAEEIKKLSQEDLAKFEASGNISVCGYDITGEELVVTRKLKDADHPDLGVNYDESSIVVMDFAKDPDLEMKFIARNIANRVQMLRKDARLQQDDPVDMWAEVTGSEGASELKDVLSKKSEYINQLLRRPLWSASLLQGHEVLVKKEEFEIPDQQDKLVVSLTIRGAFFNQSTLKALAGGDAQVENSLKEHVQSFSPPSLRGKTTLEVTIGNKLYTLKHKEHFALGPADAPWVQ